MFFIVLIVIGDVKGLYSWLLHTLVIPEEVKRQFDKNKVAELFSSSRADAFGALQTSRKIIKVHSLFVLVV